MNTPNHNDKMAAEVTVAIQCLLEFYAEEAQLDDNSKFQPEIKWEDLQEVTGKLEDYKTEVQDPLEEVNLGIEEYPRVTYVNQLLDN